MKCRWCEKELLPTDEVRPRFANKGPLPPPVVDFSTDQCPRCGKVLNQCECVQVLQRVDFNEKLKAENERLRELLREVSCSGVEHDDERIGYITVQIDRATWKELLQLHERKV